MDDAPQGQLLRHIHHDPETMTQTDKLSALHTWTRADSGKGTRTDAPIQSVGERDPVLSRAWGRSETQSRQVSGASFSGECNVLGRSQSCSPGVLPWSTVLLYFFTSAPEMSSLPKNHNNNLCLHLQSLLNHFLPIEVSVPRDLFSCVSVRLLQITRTFTNILLCIFFWVSLESFWGSLYAPKAISIIEDQSFLFGACPATTGQHL